MRLLALNGIRMIAKSIAMQNLPDEDHGYQRLFDDYGTLARDLCWVILPCGIERTYAFQNATDRKANGSPY